MRKNDSKNKTVMILLKLVLRYEFIGSCRSEFLNSEVWFHCKRWSHPGKPEHGVFQTARLLFCIISVVSVNHPRGFIGCQENCFRDKHVLHFTPGPKNNGVYDETFLIKERHFSRINCEECCDPADCVLCCVSWHGRALLVIRSHFDGNVEVGKKLQEKQTNLITIRQHSGVWACGRAISDWCRHTNMRRLMTGGAAHHWHCRSFPNAASRLSGNSEKR